MGGGSDGRDRGDDTAALAARQRLGPLLAGIEDPFLRAVCQLAMAWSLPITGDFDGALRAAAETLEELRGLDEPFFTAWPSARSAPWSRSSAVTTTPWATCARP